MADDRRRFALTRRRLMQTAATTAAAGALGVGWLAASRSETLIYSLLQRALPGVRLDPKSVGLCAETVRAELDLSYQRAPVLRAASEVKLKGVRALSQVVGVDRIAEAGPFEQRLEAITRRALTELLPHSNFFEVADPTKETVYYYPPEPGAACGNPFADLSPPV